MYALTVVFGTFSNEQAYFKSFIRLGLAGARPTTHADLRLTCGALRAGSTRAHSLGARLQLYIRVLRRRGRRRHGSSLLACERCGGVEGGGVHGLARNTTTNRLRESRPTSTPEHLVVGTHGHPRAFGSWYPRAPQSTWLQIASLGRNAAVWLCLAPPSHDASHHPHTIRLVRQHQPYTARGTTRRART